MFIWFLRNVYIAIRTLTCMVCQYFGKCGGCSGQHISYDLQLSGKKERADFLLKKAGCAVEIGVHAGMPFGYRNRMDFIFHKAGLGLRKRSQWDEIVDIAACPIANEKINLLLGEVRAFHAQSRFEVFDIRKQEGTVKYCVIRASDRSSLSFVMNDESTRLASQVELVRSFAVQTSADVVVVTYVGRKQDVSVSSEFFPVKGEPILSVGFGDVVLDYAVQGFFQNNTEMAIRMVGECRKLLGKYATKDAVLLDLFGGVGTFGVSLGSLFREVLVVESVPESIACAKDNLARNRVNGSAVVLDAARIRTLSVPDPFIAIVDPPRTGMDKKTIGWLLEKKPAAIIYISCNPEELAKELPSFMGEYRIVSANLFDLFPQTPHIELMVELQRV
jgi:23S rRNA (uracil-5-)-methyltransferase RumA